MTYRFRMTYRCHGVEYETVSGTCACGADATMQFSHGFVCLDCAQKLPAWQQPNWQIKLRPVEEKP